MPSTDLTQKLKGLEGIPDKDFVAIYNAGHATKVPAGTRIIEEGADDHVVYLLLDGELQVLKRILNKEKRIATIGPGAWVGEIAFIKRVPRTASVDAGLPSHILALDKTAFDSLDADIRLSLMTKFADLATDRALNLARHQNALLEQSSRLLSFIMADHEREMTKYENSTLIRSILDNIPRLPMFATDLLERLKDPNTTPKMIADTIWQDSSLVTQILKYVNSPYYGFHQKIADLQHAVMLLGFNQIHQLVVFNAMRATMPNAPDYKRLQAHSILISFIATELSAYAMPRRSGLVGTLGLLHNVGEGVVLLLKEAYPKISTLFDIMSHPILGSLLLQHWNLPEELCLSIRYQKHPLFAPPDEIPEAIRVNVAFLSLAHAILARMTNVLSQTTPPFFSEYMRLLGLHAQNLDALTNEIVLPALGKKQSVLPTVVRQFIKDRVADETLPPTARE